MVRVWMMLLERSLNKSSEKRKGLDLHAQGKGIWSFWGGNDYINMEK